MKKVLAVFNMNAGRKKAVRYKRSLLTFLRKNTDEYKIINIEELTQSQIADYDTVIAIGGDGTINNIIPYIANRKTALGIIPCGTANLLAAKLKIPCNLKKNFEIIKKENVKEIDALKVNEKYSVLRLGFGYDADIICKTPQSMKNKFGYLAYFIAGVLFALRLKNKFYTLTYDNQTKKIKASCIIIANAANMYRNLVSVGKNNSINDGLLDIFILKTQNPIIFFVEFLKIMLNIKFPSKYVEYIKTTNVNIKNKWRYAHIDGEKTKFNTNISINILQKVINVYTV